MFCEIRCVSNCISFQCILLCVFRRQDSHVKCVLPGVPATVQHSIETVVCTPGCWRRSHIRIQRSPDWRGGPWHKYGHLCGIYCSWLQESKCDSKKKKKKKKKLYLTPNRQLYNASHIRYKIKAIYTHAHVWTHVH